jgi:hypothetical protein
MKTLCWELGDSQGKRKQLVTATFSTLQLQITGRRGTQFMALGLSANRAGKEEAKTAGWLQAANLLQRSSPSSRRSETHFTNDQDQKKQVAVRAAEFLVNALIVRAARRIC